MFFTLLKWKYSVWNLFPSFCNYWIYKAIYKLTKNVIKVWLIGPDFFFNFLVVAQWNFIFVSALKKRRKSGENGARKEEQILSLEWDVLFLFAQEEIIFYSYLWKEAYPMPLFKRFLAFTTNLLCSFWKVTLASCQYSDFINITRSNWWFFLLHKQGEKIPTL